MSSTVNGERHIKYNCEAQDKQHPKRQPQRLIPEIPWHHSGNKNVEDRKERDIVLLLPHDNAVTFQVAHVNEFTLGHHFGMWRKE